MTIQQLEYIVALDIHRHFVTAAEKCFVTQPTLTMQLKKLENEIGLQIFDRTKSPLKPTAEGEKIILKAREILGNVNELKEMVNGERKNMEGTFKLGIIPTLAPYLLHRFIKSFSNKYPHTILLIEEMKTEDIIRSLETNQLDLAILSTPLEHPSIREVRLFVEPFLIYADPEHPLQKQKKIRQKDLPKNGLWLLQDGHCLREQVTGVCGSDSFTDSNIRYQSGSLESLKNLIKTQGGYTLLPEMAACSEDDKRFLCSFSDKIPGREISIVVHKGFIKESLLAALRESIMNTIPSDYEKHEQFVRVRWH